MLQTRVALAPYDRDLIDKPGFVEEFLQVAAALQTQVARDLSDLWGVSAVVAAFMALEQVPAGYLPLAIVKAKLPLNRTGFHFNDGGRPGALVEYGDGWAVGASHELLEMLCDPSGFATRPGPSIEHPDEYVEYVMEVSDPCEDSTYEIDGIDVSDFVTPSYYDPPGSKASRYSFTGRINRPLQLLAGGYITWFTPPPDDGVHQAAAPKGKDAQPAIADRDTLEFARLGDVPSLFSRQMLDADAQSKAERKKKKRRKHVPYAPSAPAQRYGATLRIEIERLLASMAPSPSADAALKLVKRLGDPTDAFRRAFAQNPAKELKKLGLNAPAGLTPPLNLPTAARYREVANAMEKGVFGHDFTQPGAILYLAKLA
jgi:hypothetical protein